MQYKKGTLNSDELTCWKYSRFLLDIRAGDILIYVNVPVNALCTIVEVTGPYEFSKKWDPAGWNDRRHVFPCEYIGSFDRDSVIVHPDLRVRLKRRGPHWNLKNVRQHVEELLCHFKP